MAARVAAELSNEPDAQVETIRGGFGQFDVLVDGRTVVKSSRLWYPALGHVMARVRAALEP